MSARRWLSVCLLALALVAGAKLWLQQQVAAELREEIALLREQNRQLPRLSADNARLTAAQAPAAELTRLRADHAAVAQLRAEIEKLKTNVETRERALQTTPVAKAKPVEPEPPPAVHVLAAAQWKNAGRATPLAALETMLWAGANGKIDELTRTLLLDDDSMQQAQAMFDGLSVAQQKEYGNPFGLIATLMSKDMPAGDARVTEVKSSGSLDPDPGSAELEVELHDPQGRASTARLEFQKTETEDGSGRFFWGLALSGKNIGHFNSVLHGGAGK